MATPTVKIVADVSPHVAGLLTKIAESQQASKRAVLEIAIEQMAKRLQVTT